MKAININGTPQQQITSDFIAHFNEAVEGLLQRVGAAVCVGGGGFQMRKLIRKCGSAIKHVDSHRHTRKSLIPLGRSLQTDSKYLKTGSAKWSKPGREGHLPFHSSIYMQKVSGFTAT